jgi:hypothetical protein
MSALAPDFTALPSRADVWSPTDGLEQAAEWPARRAVIRARWRHWLVGGLPAAPRGTRAMVVGRRDLGEAEERDLQIVMPAASGPLVLRAQLAVPHGADAAPVLITQTTHGDWADAAVRRGWAACRVAACDGDDDTEAIADAYPRWDGARLAWHSWALSRALDALADEDGIDAGRAVVAGHSGDGVAALLAAAFDDRFAAVMSSSSGVLGVIPARLADDGEPGGIESLTRRHPDWFHPRLRFFAGREDHLPTDAHELLALIAPRPLLIAVAGEDSLETAVAVERAAEVAREAWALLGAPAALEVQAPGGEAPAIERHLDWAQSALA